MVIGLAIVPGPQDSDPRLQFFVILPSSTCWLFLTHGTSRLQIFASTPDIPSSSPLSKQNRKLMSMKVSLWQLWPFSPERKPPGTSTLCVTERSDHISSSICRCCALIEKNNTGSQWIFHNNVFSGRWFSRWVNRGITDKIFPIEFNLVPRVGNRKWQEKLSLVTSLLGAVTLS